MKLKLLILFIAITCCWIIVMSRSRRPFDFPQDRAAIAMLFRPVSRFDCTEMSCNDTIEFLQRQAGCPIHVNWEDWQDKEDAGKPIITLHLRNVRLSDALDCVCRQLGHARPIYDVHDGQIDITTEADHPRTTVERLYPVEDMLETMYEWKAEELSAPASRPNNACFTSGDKATPAEQAQSDLLKLIVEFIDPDSWRDNGGTVGDIRVLGGALLIQQTPDNQRRIAEFLNQLRSALVRHTEGQRFASLAGGC